MHKPSNRPCLNDVRKTANLRRKRDARKVFKRKLENQRPLFANHPIYLSERVRVNYSNTDQMGFFLRSIVSKLGFEEPNNYITPKYFKIRTVEVSLEDIAGQHSKGRGAISINRLTDFNQFNITKVACCCLVIYLTTLFWKCCYSFKINTFV